MHQDLCRRAFTGVKTSKERSRSVAGRVAIVAAYTNRGSGCTSAILYSAFYWPRQCAVSAMLTSYASCDAWRTLLHSWSRKSCAQDVSLRQGPTMPLVSFFTSAHRQYLWPAGACATERPASAHAHLERFERCRQGLGVRQQERRVVVGAAVIMHGESYAPPRHSCGAEPLHTTVREVAFEHRGGQQVSNEAGPLPARGLTSGSTARI